MAEVDFSALLDHSALPSCLVQFTSILACLHLIVGAL